MQYAFGGRKILILLRALPLLLSGSAWAADPSCPDLLRPEVRLEVFEDHPYFKGEQVQVAAVTSADSERTVTIGGVATAMKHVSAESALAIPTVENVVGPSTSEIDVAVGLNGSAARYALFGSANDLDILAQLVIKVPSGNVDQLFNSRSAPLQKMVRYLQDHVEKVLLEHPSYRFIELKAGEYLDPVSGEKQGIKWWLDDFRRGYKWVKEPSGARRISLAQAIAEPARIKIDWAIPSPLDALNAFDYTEVTTIYTLGMKVGNNQARLRVSELPGTNESLLIKSTSINLSREDLLKSIELSVGENPTTLEHVHQSLVKTIEKYSGIDRLKVLKRLFALLSFWEGPTDFALSSGIAVKSNEILSQVHEVLSTDRLRILSRIRSRAEVRMVAADHGVTLGSSDQDWLQAVLRDFPELKGKTIEEVDQEVAALVESELSLAFLKFPMIPQYIDFVRKRAAFVVGQELSPKPVFLVLKPDATFRAALKKKIRVWKEKYPLLSFVDPEDAHMTVHYAGRMSAPGMDSWIQEAQSRCGTLPNAEQGGLYLFGKQSQLIALKFQGSGSFSEMAKALRAHATQVGAFPEKTFLEFTPHITLASIQDRGSQASQTQVRRFLSEETGILSSVSFEDFEIWTSPAAEVAASDPVRKYLKIR